MKYNTISNLLAYLLAVSRGAFGKKISFKSAFAVKGNT
jgi:hypothetical protein